MVSEQDVKNMSPEELLALQKKNCIFCKIAKKEIPSNVVYEDDLIIGILDIHPANEGHVLLMPKEHYPVFPQIPKNVVDRIAVVVKKLNDFYIKVLKAKGVSSYVEIGQVAGQKIFHSFIHVIPITANKVLQTSYVDNKKDDVIKLINTFRKVLNYK